MNTLKQTTLLSLIYVLNLCANEPVINSDGSEFKAPRLAGDSLPISGINTDTTKAETDTFGHAFLHGELKTLLRYSAQYRDSNLQLLQDSDRDDLSSEKKQQYSSIGGYLGYETAPLYHTSVGATFYTSQPLGNNPNSRSGLGGLNDSGADGSQQEGYTVLGEAYIKFKTKNHRLVYGKQEMPNYRFVSLSDIRMSPFTHEGLSYENTLISNLKITAAHITRQKDRNAEKFEGMVRAARVSLSSNGKQLIRGEFNPDDYIGGDYGGDEKEMSLFGLNYGANNVTLEAWNYFVDDFVNTLYLYGQYNLQVLDDTQLTFAVQYANQIDVGDSIAGDIDSWFYGLKAQASWPVGITLFTAYNEVSYNEDSYDGGTLFVRWGTPQMFNSFQVQDSELAGTKSLGFGAQFELGKMHIIPNTVIRFRYGMYDMPDKLHQRDARLDRSESTFDLRYSFTKNDGFGIFTQMQGLSVQFRIAYDDYDSVSTEKLNAYTALHGYEITNVTKDFIDTRLYLDYRF